MHPKVSLWGIASIIFKEVERAFHYLADYKNGGFGLAYDFTKKVFLIKRGGKIKLSYSRRREDKEGELFFLFVLVFSELVWLELLYLSTLNQL